VQASVDGSDNDIVLLSWEVGLSGEMCRNNRSAEVLAQPSRTIREVVQSRPAPNERLEEKSDRLGADLVGLIAGSDESWNFCCLGHD
jgi:hypothetical protein